MAGSGTAISEKRTRLGHGGGFNPPNRGGGGDGEDGGDVPDYEQRLRRARMGLTFALAPIIMLFLAFTAVYLLRQHFSTFDERTSTYIRYWLRVNLPTRLLLFNTGVLILSSATVEIARRRLAWDVALSPARSIPGVSVGREKGLGWLAATAFLGLAFLAGQAIAWQRLFDAGLSLSTSTSGAFVYLLTAAHAIHLFAGIVVLLYAVAVYFLHRPVESRHIVVDVTAWYWHFMLLLWIYIFALLEFAK